MVQPDERLALCNMNKIPKLPSAEGSESPESPKLFSFQKGALPIFLDVLFLGSALLKEWGGIDLPKICVLFFNQLFPAHDLQTPWAGSKRVHETKGFVL